MPRSIIILAQTFLTVLLLSTNALSIEPNWIKMAKSKDGSITYFNANDVHYQGKTVDYWLLTKYGTKNEYGISGSIVHQASICGTNTFEIRSIADFDSKENIVGYTDNGEKGEFNPAAPGTVAHYIVNFFCNTN